MRPEASGRSRSWLRSVRRKPSCRALVPIAVGCVVVVTAVGSAAAIQPKNLYTALLTTAYADAELPSGFTAAKVSRLTPRNQGRRFHVLGEVQVSVHGPDATDGIFYVVFPNATDARGNLARAKVSGALHLVSGRVPTYPTLPGHVYAGRISGKTVQGGKVSDGVTLVVVAKHNVLVEAFTASADSTDRGNLPAALLILKSAMHHLAIVDTTQAH